MLDETPTGIPTLPIEPQVVIKNNNHLLYVLLAIIVLLLGGLVFTLTKLSERVQPNTAVTPTPTPSITVTATPSTTDLPLETPTPTATLAPGASATISIYMFSQTKFDQQSSVEYTQAVSRKTTRKDVGTFAIEELIKGPTAAEQNSLKVKPTFGKDTFIQFVSASNCNGKDFTLVLAGTDATVKFCRGTTLSGDMAGYVISQQVTTTLKQFPTIKRVRILNTENICFDSLSGISTDQCWE